MKITVRQLALVLLRVKKRQDYRHVHAAADAAAPAFARAAKAAFALARASVHWPAMKTAIEKKHHQSIIEQTDAAITVTRHSLTGSLETLLLETLINSGQAASQKIRVAGGSGSGNFGHAGRPGEVGGSSTEVGSSTPHGEKGLFQASNETHGRYPSRGKILASFTDEDGYTTIYGGTKVDERSSMGNLRYGVIKVSSPTDKVGLKVGYWMNQPEDIGINGQSKAYKDLSWEHKAAIQVIHQAKSYGGLKKQYEAEVANRKFYGAASIPAWFNPKNEAAAVWAKAHAAELIDGISETTREAIRELVEGAFDGTVDDLAEEIENILGNDTRAELIARTESMAAANAGQQDAWDQAVDNGLLSGEEQQEWIVTADDNVCPICDSLDGQTVGLDESFEDDAGDQYDGPPAHPNCRCTVGLAAPKNAMRGLGGEGSGVRGHTTERSERAKTTFKPATRAVHEKALGGEREVAGATGGEHLQGNEPVDIVVTDKGRKIGIEVKTLIDNRHDKITMHKSSLKRKIQWARRNRATLHTVVVDVRKGLSQFYHHSGVGSFRLHKMTRMSKLALHKLVRT